MEIEVTYEQYKAFHNGESITLVPPKKEHVIEYGNDETFYVDTFRVLDMVDGTAFNYLKHGRYRKTKETAEYSLKRNQRANRLEALVEDLQGYLGVGDYWIHHNGSVFFGSSANGITMPGVVAMQKETAEKVCELLNSGKYSLEG